MTSSETVHQVIIIGSGFGGIGMAASLRKAGIFDFILLEKAQAVGGVWRDNTYPGAACDVPSHLYSFSFAPNPNWSAVFSPQTEILAYLEDCVQRLHLQQHIHFDSEVDRAQLDEHASLWRVHLKSGETFSCRVLIPAIGQLSRPLIPELPGLNHFSGHCFHSARWDHDYPLKDKRVAVIGTGASAIQFVPEIVKQVKQLNLFQRSPAYLIPRPDRRYTGIEHFLFKNLPGFMKLHRAKVYSQFESRTLAFSRLSGLMKPLVGKPFQQMLEEQVPDPQLREKLTPDYPIGCKRILISNDYLAAMSEPNLNLITEGIDRIDEKGIHTRDGQYFPVDAIILGTGFAATEFLAPMKIIGRQGRDLNTAWNHGAEAYLGMTVPGFPNFFMIYGPNTNLGHNSIIYMLESQMRHIVRCLEKMRTEQADQVEVNEDEFRSFNNLIQQKLKHHVWAGCHSWYVDSDGHNSTNWPGFTLRYRWLTQHTHFHYYTFRQIKPRSAMDTTSPSPTTK